MTKTNEQPFSFWDDVKRKQTDQLDPDEGVPEEAKKPAFKAGGTLLKKKNKPAEAKPEANPWDNLDEDKPAQMLNEDQLMTEADKDGSIAKTFAGSGHLIIWRQNYGWKAL